MKLTEHGFEFYNGYDVDFATLDTTFDLVRWLWHLNEKIWWTPQIQADFMELAIQAFEYPTTPFLNRTKP